MAYPVMGAAPVTANQPDLLITDVTASPSLVPGGQVILSATVKNRGSTSSSHFSTSFYLSRDPIIDSSDAQLGRSDITSLAPDDSLTISSPATIPSEFSGDGYIIAKADAFHAVSEKNEMNNIRYSSKITIEPAVPTTPPATVSTTVPNSPPLSSTPSSTKPDLVITGAVAPLSVIPGEQAALLVTIENVGDATASSSYVEFFLSPDERRDASDLNLGTASVSSIPAGGSQTISCSVKIPREKSGQFYILTRADGTGLVAEKNEGNNQMSSNLVSVQSESITVPTSAPTTVPTTAPIKVPTSVPTTVPTSVPTTVPTSVPTTVPTSAPTTVAPKIPVTETFGAESNPTGNPLGGGAGYKEVYTEHDARVTAVVNSRAEFTRVLASAKAGDVIYIPEKVSINLSGVYPTRIPAGVTIASNRGVNGSQGGRIFQKRLPNEPGIKSMLYISGDDVRITGLRLEGPDQTTQRLSSVGLSVRDGIRAYDQDNLEVDNCEIWGWSNGGVDFVLLNGGYGYVHHNYFHHIQTEGMGYAVVQYGGRTLVEGNIFDQVKNPVAGGGLVGEGYEARYNLVNHTTSKSHSFDIHPFTDPATGRTIAGSSYKIHHNTVRETENYAVLLSGVPLEGVWIDHNKFQWRTYSDGRPYPIPGPVVQNMGVGNVFVTKNLIGTPEVFYVEGPIYYINDSG